MALSIHGPENSLLSTFDTSTVAARVTGARADKVASTQLHPFIALSCYIH